MVDGGTGLLYVIGAFIAFVGIVYWASGTSEKRNSFYKYVPPGAVILKEKEWNRVRENIAKEIEASKVEGIELGRRQIISAIEGELSERAKPRVAREVLGIDPTKELSIGLAQTHYQKMRALYDPKNFEHLDPEFQKLASIRLTEIDNAFRVIANMVKYGSNI